MIQSSVPARGGAGAGAPTGNGFGPAPPSCRQLAQTGGAIARARLARIPWPLSLARPRCASPELVFSARQTTRQASPRPLTTVDRGHSSRHAGIGPAARRGLPAPPGGGTPALCLPGQPCAALLIGSTMHLREGGGTCRQQQHGSAGRARRTTQPECCARGGAGAGAGGAAGPAAAGSTVGNAGVVGRRSGGIWRRRLVSERMDHDARAWAGAGLPRRLAWRPPPGSCTPGHGGHAGGSPPPWPV